MSRTDDLPHLDIVGHDVYELGVPFDAYDEFRRVAPVARRMVSRMIDAGGQ